MEQTALQVLRDNEKTLKAITEFNYGDSRDVTSIVLNEISFLEGISLTKPEVLQCERSSIEMAMKFVLKNNLSFDPNAGLVYVKTRNITLANQSKSKVLEIQPTCEGLISIAYQCGKIIDHERPTIKKDEAGKVIEVTFKYMKNSPTGARWVDVTFDESDFLRWATASHNENGRFKEDRATKNYANKLYFSFKGGIDPEFARAKAIRHAMKKMGTNINERINVNIKPTIQHTVDVKTDIETLKDDLGESSSMPAPEYHPFEESTSNEAPKVKVTVHEEIPVPNL